MRAADEVQDPVAYDDRWLLLALLALVAVALYYAVVLWFGRRRPTPTPERRLAREVCLARLDEIAAAVTAGRISPRHGHQQLSEEVRGFVAETSGVPARTMTLADLEREGPEQLAAVVALVYPPEFAADESRSGDGWDAALDRARELVSSWT